MSFLDKALEGKGLEEQPVLPIEPEPTPEPDPIVEPETVVEPTPDNTPEPEPEVTKEEIEYKDWLNSNEDVLYNFLKEKKTDYTQLSQEELVARKIKAENPEYDANDVKEELQEKYGIGLELKEIDEDSMTPEEISEAKAHNAEVNKQISKGTRALKKDAGLATKFFEEGKQSLELPKFEIERKGQAKPDNLFTAEDFLEAQSQSLKEEKEKNWIPTLKQVIEPFEGIKKQVEYEDNGNKVLLDVDYKLSKQEKDEVLASLSDYIQQPTDTKYFDAEGKADVQRFVHDKVAEINLDKLLKTVAKEAAANARKSFVKNDLINFDDGIKNRGEGNPDESSDRGFFKHAASQTKNKL